MIPIMPFGPYFGRRNWGSSNNLENLLDNSYVLICRTPFHQEEWLLGFPQSAVIEVHALMIRKVLCQSLVTSPYRELSPFLHQIQLPLLEFILIGDFSRRRKGPVWTVANLRHFVIFAFAG